MTNQHPLTDEIIEDILLNRYWWELEPCQDSLRDAADWQLEQCLEWLKVNLMKHDFHEGYAYLYDDCSNAEIEVDKVLEDLRKAMRPE